MKRTKLKRRSRTPLALAKDKLWAVIKQLIDIRDGTNCISCNATGISGHHKHGGHFIPSASCGGFLRYDIRNVHNQCSTCNLFYNGAGAQYTLALQKKYGMEFVEKIIADKNAVIKLDLAYVNAMTDYYKSLLTKTQKQLISLTKKYNGFRIS